MSGLFVAPPAFAIAVSTARFCESPAPDTLGVDDLDLLTQLFEPAEPADYSVAFPSGNTPSKPPTPKRELRSTSASEPSPKRLRVSSSTYSKINKTKSQSQRQKEEMVLLRQQIEELSTQLGSLQEWKRQRATDETGAVDSEIGSTDQDHWSSLSAITTTSTTVATRSVGGSKQLWRRIAKRQLAELKSVEEENASLRDEVAKQWKQMKSLQRSVITAQMDQLRQMNQHKQGDELGAMLNSA